MDRLAWGLVGGGEDSQIGFAHRAGATLDRRFELVAGAMDADPARGREYAKRIGVEPDRAYGDWREMLDGERIRDDRPHLVTVATPNATHFEISKSYLEAGFHVLCEKPLTMTPDSAWELCKIARANERILAVNYGYSGYPMLRQAKAMVRRGELGRIRVVVAEFAGGFLADARDMENPRVKWRFDPEQVGVSSITGDAGIHALHAACFATGQYVRSLSADFATGIEGRKLEDDSLIAFRMTSGTVGRLWSSGLAIGRAHGLTLQIFGERGGLQWQQEHPGQIKWTPLGEATQILEKGGSNLHPEAERAARIPIGHPEGMVFAFSNIYRDLADVIASALNGREPDPLALDFPRATDGAHSIDAIHAAAKSAELNGIWTEVPQRSI